MPNLILKQFDTYPPLQATLTDVNGPINLTTATSVKVILKGNASNVLVTGTCTVVSAVAGTVSYAWAIGDTNTPDTYQVEFEIHWTGGGVQTVPSAAASNPTVEIDSDLEGV